MTKNLQRRRRIFAVLALPLALLLVAACTERSASQPEPAKQPDSAAAGTPEAAQVGVTPAGPGAEAAATTFAAKSDMSKDQQSGAMPMPGQANDHSTLEPKPPAKAASSAN